MADSADPEITVDGDDEAEETVFDFDDDDPNLCFVFAESEEGLKFLEKASKQVLEDFEDAWESSKEYRERAGDDWRMFAGELPKKSWPFEKSANAHLPLMLENISRIAFRAQAELFGDWNHVFDVLGVGPDDDNIAQLLTRHGNWQLGQQLPDFKRQQARGVLTFFSMGDVTAHSYYDKFREQNAHEILTCDEFVTPYSHVTTMPDYSDLPYVCKVCFRYKHELKAMKDEWYDVDKVLARQAPSWEDDPESEYRKATAEAQGIEVTESKRANAYKLIWYEGWMDLPARDGGEEETRFVQCIVDHTTKAVLSLTIHEEEDWQDRERYNREMAEGEAYAQNMQAFQAAQTEWTLQSQAHAEIQGEIGQVAMDPQHAADLNAALPPMGPAPVAPPMPDWMINAVPDETGGVLPAPVKKKPLHMFSHGVCIESLVGNLGLSFGRQQADHNRAVDTWLSQFTDSATLNNCWTLITTGNAEFDTPFGFAPGKVNRLKNVLPGEIDKHIKELKPAPANSQLMDLIALVWDKAQSSIQSSPVLSGEAGKSGETFRGVATRVEQASKQLSVPTRWYADFLTQIIKNNAKLNALFLKDEEIFMVNNDRAGKMEELRLGREMYVRNYQIRIKADLDFASQDSRIAAADELVQMPAAVPPLQANPKFLYDALRKSLELRGRYDLVDDLGPPPPPTTIPFGAPPPLPPGMPPGEPPPGEVPTP